jgi:MFS family permease
VIDETKVSDQGTFFGALAAAPFADKLGRRMGLLVAVGFVFNFGVVLQTASTRQPLFIAGRFFAGLGVGLLSAMGKSITPKNSFRILMSR